MLGTLKLHNKLIFELQVNETNDMYGLAFVILSKLILKIEILTYQLVCENELIYFRDE